MESFRIAAGLPNITSVGTGEFRPNTNFQSGASYRTNTNGDTLGVSTTMKLAGFNASRCSTIYGNSSTVTPLSLSSIFIIKY